VRLTLGIDSSTQGVKAVAWDVDAQKVAFSAAVNYGRDLPAYGSPDGFLPNDDVLVRQADPRMWIEGLKLVLRRLQETGCPMADIAAIGGDAQQHATVYLQSLVPLVFSRPTSPIWMDSSTGAEVAALDARFGARLQTDTGSPAIERFAGPQIMKFAKEDPDGYAKTKRIHLLSSFLASYLVGEDMPIDSGDGAGMNLLNLKTGEWDAEICEFVAPGLLPKLPAFKHSNIQNSNIPNSFSKPLNRQFAKCGLRPGIPVVPFTGDNPASLVGCFAETPGTAVISLGTSDVFFAAMDKFHTDPDGYGHVFGNPMGAFMSLSCFKNGSLARDRVRRELGVDWNFFDEEAWLGEAEGQVEGWRLEVEQWKDRHSIVPPPTSHLQPALQPALQPPPKAFPYFESEITPKHEATGIEANFDWAAADAATKVRAIVEGQIVNMYERTRWIHLCQGYGGQVGDFNEIKVTGGASRSKGIRETIARVFGAKVTALDVTDSAAVGGARLAERALT